jgi:uncharacterized protein YbbC (DUF1343 family)
MQVGLEKLRADNFDLLKGKRVGLMTNPSAVDSQFVSTYEIFSQSDNVNLTTLFGPEHGMAAAAPDAASVDNAIDARTGLPIYSLYGKTYRPTPNMLGNLDVLVCDIQDVGVRFYTYIWTISYILEVCGEQGKEVVILDRPNPIGDGIAGGSLEEEMSSFVGRFDMPIRHGLTVGELSQMINQLWNPSPCQLTIVTCDGWERTMRWNDTNREFVQSSPSMPNFMTALHYPGSCMLEGTYLSEGRGTSLPFQCVGTPYIDGDRLAEKLNAQSRAGVRFRPQAFLPTSSKYAGETCYGVQLHITDVEYFDPIRAWLATIIEIKTTYTEQFKWLPPNQREVERGSQWHFDRLMGSKKYRQMIDSGASVDDLMDGWSKYCDDFHELRKPYLIYPER